MIQLFSLIEKNCPFILIPLKKKSIFDQKQLVSDESIQFVIANGFHQHSFKFTILNGK